jgi:hypothetical protein
MQEEAVLTYCASNMVLAIHSDASYLAEAKARSQAGGHMFMAGKDKITRNNEAILNISQIILAVMSSAAEAELGALFINAKTAVSMQQTFQELGHPQPLTPMQTDNATAQEIPLGQCSMAEGYQPLGHLVICPGCPGICREGEAPPLSSVVGNIFGMCVA